MDAIESLGAVLKNFTAARNMVKQSILIHRKTLCETGTAITGLRSTASPAKAIAQSCLPDRTAARYQNGTKADDELQHDCIPAAGSPEEQSPCESNERSPFHNCCQHKTSNSPVVF